MTLITEILPEIRHRTFLIKHWWLIKDKEMGETLMKMEWIFPIESLPWGYHFRLKKEMGLKQNVPIRTLGFWEDC